MTTARAAVLHAMPGPLRVEEVTVDRPGPREVLVRTAAAGLCHTDLLFMQGMVAPLVPLVPGHESAGVVEAVGRDVGYVEPGDHVITCPSAFCGHCDHCLGGRPALCESMVGARKRGEAPRLSLDGARCHALADLGSFAELMLVHEHSLVKVTRDMPLDRAALIGCAVTTGLGAVFRTAAVDPGSTVAVVGCGGVGLNCVQGAVLAGAGRVVAVDVNPAKLSLAATFGATDLVDATAGNPIEQVRALFPGRGRSLGGVDYAFEAAGRKQAAEQAFAMVRRGGTATVIGLMAPDVVLEVPASDLLAEKKLQGSLMGSNRFRHDIPRYVELYLQGRLRLDELVSARIGLHDIDDGFRAMDRGEGARSLVIFE